MSAPTNTRNWNGLTIPTPGKFVIDASHTRVGFVARHLMVTKVRGSFPAVSGELVVGDDPRDSSVAATMETASITTGSEDRDKHLRSPDFLDVEKFPELTFRSKSLSEQDGTSFTLVGDLTIKDVTREVELRVDFEGVATSPWGSEVLGFTARTEIDREDFGITWNVALETGGVLVSKKVTIEIEAEAIRQ
jgi:polyisoprenoid-binding protein YceI